MEEQIKIFNTDITNAADDLLEAHKAFIDVKDRLEVTRKHLASLLVGQGLKTGQFLLHDGKKLKLKEGKVTDDTVTISNVKE